MKYLKYLLLLGLAIQVASAQQPEVRRDSLRQKDGNKNLDFNAPINLNAKSDEASSLSTLGQRYGLYVGAGFNSYSADFRNLPGVPNCCSRFTEGTGVGTVVGFLSEFPLSNEFALQVRAGYAGQKGVLRASEFSVVGQGDSVALPALFEHTIEASPANITIAPIFGYRITDRLTVHAGPELGYQITKGFHQYEKIVEPETGHFTNGKRVRNDFMGDLPDNAAVQASLLIGTSYEIPFNKSESVIAAPEAFYSLGLTNLVNGLDWKVNTLRIGMALKFAPSNMGSKETEQPPVLAAAEPEHQEFASAALSAGVSAMAVNEFGQEIPLEALKVQDIILTNRRPLLNYVFFDENSSAIPDRYAKLTPESAGKFKVKDLDSEETLPTYYNMLNILGSRLRENPSARITIVGTNADLGVEKGNRQLSMDRAYAVRDYLHDVWNIDSRRMNIEARNLPEQPSAINDPDGVAENRRVEIIPNDPEVTEPLFTTNTERHPSVPTIRFRPSVVAQAGVGKWSLLAMQDGKVLRRFDGSGEVPQELDWNLEEQQAMSPRAPGKIEYSLEVYDNNNQLRRTPLASIPVERSEIVRDQNSAPSYKKVDRYSMILFDYNKAQLNAANRRVADVVNQHISQGATVSVTGHTDRIGDSEYNRKLSEDRARMTASVLNVSSPRVSGVGEEYPKYTNDLPEGRFYNRTVDVEVETPVK